MNSTLIQTSPTMPPTIASLSRSAMPNTRYLVDDVAALLGAVVMRFRQHDLDFLVMRQIVQRGDDRPAVHLALVDLLSAVIEPGGIAQAHRVGGREQPERRMRLDHLVLV